MNRIIRNSFSSILLLALSACNLFAPANREAVQSSVLTLTVQTQNNVTTFNQAGEIINYEYVLTNTGATPLAGPVLVEDGPRQVACPQLATIGNQDDYLDQNETITCTAAYMITDSDVNTGSVTNLAVATIGGITSNQAGITLTRGQPQPSSVMTLTKTASSQTYGQVGETISYMYVITNVGNEALGPAQFTINDDKVGTFNCGPDATTIAPAQTLSCSASYLITQEDMNAVSLTNNATAAGDGQTTAVATVTITNLLAPATDTPPVPATAMPPASGLTPGSTIQHQVAVGEWLIQIGRCYAADFKELREANPQIADPDFILPSMIVTVPRIGSTGRPIYGPPCITFHTVQNGETWESIAQHYNANLIVLQRVNPGALVPGTSIKIPLNSAGGGPVVVTPGVTTEPPSQVTTVAPMRIEFDPGQNTASRIGILNPDQTIQYILAATQGQMLSIQLIAPAEEVNLGVMGPTGLALKQPDPTYTWTSNILNSGDHTISLTSILGNSSKSYTLQVSLTSASTPDPATATSP